MIQSSDIACLILASGSSARFGSSKMLHTLDDGLSILAKTIGIYAQVFEQVNVVVREGDSDVIKLVKENAAVCILNANADQGLSQSVVSGVSSTTPARAWLCALGDMPYVSSNTVKAIAARVLIDNIVVPKTEFGSGNPVALGAHFRDELLELKGDRGAKHLIKRHTDLVHFYQCNDQGVHQDIDRLSDIL